MGSEETSSDAMTPETLTELLTELEPGEQFTLNNHDRTYTVSERDTYSVIAKDESGHQVTISQNLQTGGWSVNETVIHIELAEDAD